MLRHRLQGQRDHAGCWRKVMKTQPGQSSGRLADRATHVRQETRIASHRARTSAKLAVGLTLATGSADGQIVRRRYARHRHSASA